MSYDPLNLIIYGETNTFPPEKEEIKELIIKTLSYAPIITIQLDQNDIDIRLKPNLPAELQLRYAESEQIKKYLDNNLIYDGTKEISFQFESKEKDNSPITFCLFPRYGEKIDYDSQEEEKQLKNFKKLGYLTLHGGEFGSLDPHFFELAKNIITDYILEIGYADYLIDFQGSEKESTIMEPNEFLNKIEDLRTQYCDNPNFEK